MMWGGASNGIVAIYFLVDDRDDLCAVVWRVDSAAYKAKHVRYEEPFRAVAERDSRGRVLKGKWQWKR